MIVLNEEKCLGRALNNVSPYVDEIVIVDGGSKDGTVNIAKKFNATIIHAPWEEHFSRQRNIGLKHAAKEWILSMDADETYEKRLLVELQRLVNNNIGIDAFAFPRKNYIDGKRTKAYPDKQIRLIRNNGKIKYAGRLHEQPVGWKRLASLMDIHIIHRKSSIRQLRQNKHYRQIAKQYLSKVK